MADPNSVIKKNGKIVETLPAGSFRVKLDDENREIIAHLAGKMRMNHIRILPGDKVILEMSPYDLTKGRITFRLK